MAYVWRWIVFASLAFFVAFYLFPAIVEEFIR